MVPESADVRMLRKDRWFAVLSFNGRASEGYSVLVGLMLATKEAVDLPA